MCRRQFFFIAQLRGLTTKFIKSKKFPSCERFCKLHMSFATLHNPIRENFIMRLCIHKFLSNLYKNFCKLYVLFVRICRSNRKSLQWSEHYKSETVISMSYFQTISNHRQQIALVNLSIVMLCFHNVDIITWTIKNCKMSTFFVVVLFDFELPPPPILLS